MIAIRYLKGIASLNVSGKRLLKYVLQIITGFAVAEQQYLTQRCMSFMDGCGIQVTAGICRMQSYTASIQERTNGK